MIEAVAEHDDHLFEKFIEGQPLTERRNPRTASARPPSR